MLLDATQADACRRTGPPGQRIWTTLLTAIALFAGPQGGLGAHTQAGQALPAPAQGTATGDSTFLSLRKRAGPVLHRPLAGGESHTYRVALQAGQAALLVVKQQGIDVVVEVLDPMTQPLAVFDDESRPTGEEHVLVVAGSSGNYQVRVRARFIGDAAARYGIGLFDLHPASAADDHLFAARTLSVEAESQSNAGHYVLALALAHKAVSEAEKALGPDGSYVGELSGHAGAIAFMQGDQGQATALLQRAIGIDEKAGGESQQLAVALLDIGRVYIALNNYAKADEVSQRALRIIIQGQGAESPGAARALAVVSLLHQSRGDFTRALSEIQHALAIDRNKLEPGDRITLRAMDSLGDLYFDLHDYERAVPVLQQTLRLMQQMMGPDHPAVAHPLQNLGIIARDEKQYPLALEYLWHAEKIRELALGSQHATTAALLVNIGNVYGSQGDYAKAIATHLRALAVLEKAAGPYHEWTLMTLGNLARCYAAQGNTADAVRYMARLNAAAETNLSLNLAIGSEHDRLAYADKLSYHSSRSISLHLSEAPDDPAAADLAAEMILQRKGRVLDAVADSMGTLRRRLDPAGQKLLGELHDTVAELARTALHGPGQTKAEDYETRLAALQSRKAILETEISRRSAGYYQQADSVTLSAVRKAIPADSVLLEFAVYQPYDFHNTDRAEDQNALRYVVYVIPAEGAVRGLDLGDAKEIDAAVDAYRLATHDPKRADASGLARVVDAKVMQPVRALGVEGKHLILSPDGELNLLSFESLVDEGGHYLIENSSISYVTAGRDLLRMQVARASHGEPVVIADPLFGFPHAAGPGPVVERTSGTKSRPGSVSEVSHLFFAPLAGTASEARDLQSVFPKARLLTGQHASKAELEHLDSPTILHIATHGFFLEDPARKEQPVSAASRSTRGARASLDTENPLLRSGLALAGANFTQSGDGILTALEASNLNLWGTKLVTLSACDTGMGEVRNGEGVYGLRRAFFIAGAETVVMSLWPVSDAVTRDLMSTYYRGLQAGLGRGDALRQAQLAMLHQKGHEHPFYWGSFIQVGDWAPLDGRR